MLYVFLLFCFCVAIETKFNGPCEETDAVGNTIYHPCHPTPIELTSVKGLVDLSVSPTDSTCGDPAENFCIKAQNCLPCNSSKESERHLLSSILDQNTSTWWQSKILNTTTSNEIIYVTLLFHGTFVLTNDIVINLKSMIPDDFILEKSIDFGKSWTTLQYYSKNCTEYFKKGFGNESSITKNEPNVIICSEVTKPNEPIKFNVFDRFSLYKDDTCYDTQAFYIAYESRGLQQFLTFTSLRLKLVMPKKLQNKDTSIYAISGINVTGRCWCNLHASKCNIVKGSAKCDCQHWTGGSTCDTCDVDYTGHDWIKGSYLPYPNGTANHCRICPNENCSAMYHFHIHTAIFVLLSLVFIGLMVMMFVPESAIKRCFGSDDPVDLKSDNDNYGMSKLHLFASYGAAVLRGHSEPPKTHTRKKSTVPQLIANNIQPFEVDEKKQNNLSGDGGPSLITMQRMGVLTNENTPYNLGPVDEMNSGVKFYSRRDIDGAQIIFI